MKSLIKKASWLKPMRVAAMIIVTGLSLVAYEDLRALMSTGPAVMTGNASAVTNQYTGTSGAYDRSYQGYGVPDFNMEDAVSPLPLPKPPALPLPEPPPLTARRRKPRSRAERTCDARRLSSGHLAGTRARATAQGSSQTGGWTNAGARAETEF